MRFGGESGGHEPFEVGAGALGNEGFLGVADAADVFDATAADGEIPEAADFLVLTGGVGWSGAGVADVAARWLIGGVAGEAVVHEADEAMAFLHELDEARVMAGGLVGVHAGARVWGRRACGPRPVMSSADRHPTTLCARVPT